MIKTSTGFAEQSKKTNTLYKPMILYNGKQIADEVQDFVYEGTVADSASFSFGTACSQKCSFSINNPTENLTGKELEVKYGTMVNGQMEYIRLGYFTCLKPEIDRGVATYTLMDRMSVKMGMPYFPTVKTPTTDIDILKDICKQSGVALSSKALGKSHTVSSIPNGYTYREMLCYIAQMQGCNAVINSDGELELRWYVAVDYVLDDAHIYADGTAHVDAETPFSVGYVACVVRDPAGEKEDVELRSGTGAAGITIENPMMTQAILDDVYSRVSKMSFYPAEFEFCGDFRLELGDIVSVVTGGENYNVAVMEITHKCSYGLVTTISSVAQTDAEDGLDQESPVTKGMDRYYANLVTINKALVNKLDAETARITYATIKDLEAESAKVDDLKANMITADQLNANYARLDKANIDKGWIDTAMIGDGVVGTAQIADGSITDAKIVSLTANKLTAGKIDAGEIEVVNLKAENITVGKINGTQIADGAISLGNLGSDVKSSLGDIQSSVSDALKEAGIANAGVSDLKKSVEENVKDLQSQIDGAVNTWTGADVPTTTNYPASEWRTDAVRATHIGDIYYIEEGAENAGYAYRYQQNSAGAYGWVLLKDSDVTKAIQDAAEANKTAGSAKETADTAKNTADSAIEKADGATNSASLANVTAEAAKSAAENANKTASSAETTAKDASQAASEAQKTAGNANSNASNALEKVDKSLASSVMEYYKSSSASEPTGGAWSAEKPEWEDGWYIWSRQKTASIDGKTINYSAPACITGNTGKQGERGDKGATGAAGADGKSIGQVINYYLATASATGVTTTTSGWTTSVQSVSATKKYLWNYEVIKYTDGTVASTSAPCIIGAYGDKGATGAKGDTGNGIAKTETTYQASTSGTTAPTGDWLTSPPTVAAGSYLWTRTVYKYTDNTTVTAYSVGKMGTNGTNGAAGRGIKSTAITYQAAASGTTVPTGTWSSSVPKTSSAFPYVWSRTVLTYTDNTTSTTYSVGSTPDSVLVGGRNLLKNSNSIKNWIKNDAYTTVSSVTENDVDCIKFERSGDSTTTPSITISNPAVLLEWGTVYTASCWLKCDVDTPNKVSASTPMYWHFKASSSIPKVNINDGSPSAGSVFLIEGGSTFKKNEWKRIVLQLKTLDTAPDGYPYALFKPFIYGNMGVTITNMVMKDYKLEKGNRATDWTPAPEDTDQKISEVDKKAENATAIANGKNTAYYSASQPTGGTYMTNDVWYDTDDGYRMYYWSGKAWTAAQYGTNAIAAGSITTALLNAEAVTAGKIAAGAVSADKIAANAVTADKILASAVTAAKIATNAVEADKIKAGAITAGKIATDAVETGNLKASCVTTEKISTGAITTGLLAANAVTSDKIVAEAITSAKIASNAVTSNKILAGAVTADKIDVADLFAQELTATNLKVTGKSTLSGVTATDLTVSGASSFSGDITAKTLKLLQDGLTFEFGTSDVNGLRIKQVDSSNSANYSLFAILKDSIQFRSVADSKNSAITLGGLITSIMTGGQISLGSSDTITISGTKGVAIASPAKVNINGTQGTVITNATIDGKKMSDKAEKIEFYSNEPGSGIYRYIIRFPDIKFQIAINERFFNASINSAWGSGYESGGWSVSDWFKPFKYLFGASSFVSCDAETDVWVSSFKRPTESFGGSYYLQRQTKLDTSRTYALRVIGMGIYD